MQTTQTLGTYWSIPDIDLNVKMTQQENLFANGYANI